MANSFFQSAFGDAAKGYEGRIARSGTDCAIRGTYYNAETSATIPFARAARRKTGTEWGLELPASTSDTFKGVTLAFDGLARDNVNSEAEYPINRSIALLEEGYIFVKPEQTVTADDDVYVRVTDGGGALTAGRFRKDGDGNSYPKVSLTLSGELDDGRERVQTLTFNQDIVAAETIDLTIGGQAVSQVTFGASHAATVAQMVAQIEGALALSNQLATVAITDSAQRVIAITSYGDRSATSQAITGIVIATAAGLTLTAADQQAGASAHSLTCTVDGDTVSSEWAGSHDATVHQFANELAGHPKVSAAVITEVLAGPDLVITLTGANKVADDIDLAAAAASGGATSRTIAVDNEVVVGAAAKAVLWANAKWIEGAAADGIAVLEVRK